MCDLLTRYGGSVLCLKHASVRQFSSPGSSETFPYTVTAGTWEVVRQDRSGDYIHTPLQVYDSDNACGKFVYININRSGDYIHTPLQVYDSDNACGKFVYITVNYDCFVAVFTGI